MEPEPTESIAHEVLTGQCEADYAEALANIFSTLVKESGDVEERLLTKWRARRDWYRDVARAHRSEVDRGFQAIAGAFPHAR